MSFPASREARIAWRSYCGGAVGLEFGVGSCEFVVGFVGFGMGNVPKGLCP
jgi:hypothetical protein